MRKNRSLRKVSHQLLLKKSRKMAEMEKKRSRDRMSHLRISHMVRDTSRSRTFSMTLCSSAKT